MGIKDINLVFFELSDGGNPLFPTMTPERARRLEQSIASEKWADAGALLDRLGMSINQFDYWLYYRFGYESRTAQPILDSVIDHMGVRSGIVELYRTHHHKSAADTMVLHGIGLPKLRQWLEHEEISLSDSFPHLLEKSRAEFALGKKAEAPDAENVASAIRRITSDIAGRGNGAKAPGKDAAVPRKKIN